MTLSKFVCSTICLFYSCMDFKHLLWIMSKCERRFCFPLQKIPANFKGWVKILSSCNWFCWRFRSFGRSFKNYVVDLSCGFLKTILYLSYFLVFFVIGITGIASALLKVPRKAFLFIFAAEDEKKREYQLGLYVLPWSALINE